MYFTPEQQKENRKKWLDALRSNNFKQTKSALKDEEGYCCLGVACHISDLGFWKFDEYNDNYNFHVKGTDETNNSVLPPIVTDWLGITDNTGSYRGPTQHEDDEHMNECLASDNDTGSTFEEIADIIEREWPV